MKNTGRNEVEGRTHLGCKPRPLRLWGVAFSFGLDDTVLEGLGKPAGPEMFVFDLVNGRPSRHAN